jgi:hypothetical protein
MSSSSRKQALPPNHRTCPGTDRVSCFAVEWIGARSPKALASFALRSRSMESKLTR